MASLKEIKGRIASVQSTQKITSAMRMVASAKLHRTQLMTQNFLVYIDELKSIVEQLGHTTQRVESLPEGEEVAPLKSVALIPVSSGSGLCGAFNSNIYKATLEVVKEYKAQGVSVTVIPIGKKVAHDLKRDGLDFCSDYQLTAEAIGRGDAYMSCLKLVEYLQAEIAEGAIEGVEFIYHHFHSMGKQVVTREKLDLSLPEVDPSMSEKQRKEGYITEPSPAELLAELHPKMLNSKVYGIMLDSVTSEHAARMLAMQTADDNAKELLQELTLLYNKSRQQAITNELIDIMGGKVASN